MKKAIIFLFIISFIVLLFIGCTKEETKDELDGSKLDANVKAECKIDADCSIAGCSGQICSTNEKAKGIMTTCEFKPEYECLILTKCSCINGRCRWDENEKYKECVEEEKRQDSFALS